MIYISADTFKIVSFTGKVINEYFIIAEKSKWKIKDIDGISKFKVMNTSDSSIHDIRLILRRGKGNIQIFERGQCKVSIEIEKEGNVK